MVWAVSCALCLHLCDISAAPTRVCSRRAAVAATTAMRQSRLVSPRCAFCGSFLSSPSTASGKRKGARASKRAAPVQAQPSDGLAADAKERERENKALREESKALLAKNDALLAKNEALDEKLGEAERTKDASLADRLRRTMEDNRKAIAGLRLDGCCTFAGPSTLALAAGC